MVAAIMMAALALGVLPAIPVHASGSISVSVSASTLNIGESVTVTANASGPGGESVLATMSFSYDSGILEFVSCSEDTYGGGGGNISVAGTGKASITLRAIAPGTASISVSGWDAVNSNDAAVEYGDLSGGGTSVTVNNAAGGGDGGGNAGNNGGGGDDNTDNGGDSNAAKSGDNSLRSLAISPGKLSPAFTYSNTHYTASVSEDVTSVAVDATPSNANAVVESVTGNTNLEMGANTIKITVRAENGTLATYTIVVTRGGAPEEEEEEDPEETEEEKPEGAIEINGKSFMVSSVLPDDTFPEEFAKTTVTYNNEEVEAYTFPYGGLTLFYLRNATEPDSEEEEETAEGRYFFYNSQQNQFFPYINIAVGEVYVLMLPSSYAETPVPEGYQAAVLAVEDFAMDACQLPSDNSEIASEFYLVYGVDKNGNPGWYTYDSRDKSLQRYVANTYIVEKEEPQAEDTSVADQAQRKIQEMDKKYKEEKSKSRMIMAVLIFLLAAAVVAIVNILIFYRRGAKKKTSKDLDIDYIDFDDL